MENEGAFGRQKAKEDDVIRRKLEKRVSGDFICDDMADGSTMGGEFE